MHHCVLLIVNFSRFKLTRGRRLSGTPNWGAEF
jgi:hypothetical protein